MCFALAGDPHGYVCSLPVHQDGSCNGLQHYAALGRDAAGGAAVNLIPSDRPQDVYTDVLKLVRRAPWLVDSARPSVPTIGPRFASLVAVFGGFVSSQDNPLHRAIIL